MKKELYCKTKKTIEDYGFKSRMLYENVCLSVCGVQKGVLGFQRKFHPPTRSVASTKSLLNDDILSQGLLLEIMY
jgi:hypothetical protein